VRPIAPPVLLLVGFVSEGSEVSVEEGKLSEPVLWVFPDALEEEREEEPEEKAVVEPVMLNCWDCARMATPVGFC